jgi:hypothetical protein
MKDPFFISNSNPTLGMPLFDLLVPFPVRTQLLSNLSAYDVAKLNLVFRGFLDSSEKESYLNPLRDLIWNIHEFKALQAHGMRLLLVGNDVLALQQRLEQPGRYIQKYGHSRKLRIYLTGHCPVLVKSTQIRDRMIEFSIDSTPSKYSIFEDTLQIRKMKARILYESLRPDTNFIMSFGASTPMNERSGFWLQVPDIPDVTVDLRIFVPSFEDREWGKVQFPCREALRLSQCVLRRAFLLSFLADIICICLRIRVVGVAYLSSSGLQPVGPYGRLWLERQMSINPFHSN